MTHILIQALTGLSSAAILFLVASGLTLVFGVSRIANFAHGSLAMLGAYLAWSFASLGFFPATILAALAVGLLGLLLEALLLRRLADAPELLQLLATFGVLLIVQDATLRLWGPDDLILPRPPWLRAAIPILGQLYPLYDLALIALGPTLLAALWLLLHRTGFGRELRAATENPAIAGALGVNQRRLQRLTMLLGSALAGLAGALLLPETSANPQMDLTLVVDAFVVVVVGGLGSLPGAFLASLLIGLLQAFGILFFPGLTLALAFLVMAAVLALRPHGLLGAPLAEGTAPVRPILLRPARPWQRAAALAALAVALAAPWLAGAFTLALLTEAALAVLFATSLHLAMGPGGMPSFGHAAWFGLGAYAAALSATAGAPVILALLAGALVAGLLAAALGTLVVRRAGVYLAMLTLAFSQIIWALSVQWVGLTGGDDGILGVRLPGLGPRGLYWLALALGAGGAALFRRIQFARFGAALRATRDAPARAAAIGLPVMPLRLAAFTLSGAAAGLSGAGFAYAKGAVFPTYAAIPQSVNALVMVLAGGIASASGPVLGALAYTGAYDLLLQGLALWRLAIGLLIVALVLWRPAGLLGGRA